MLTGTGPRPIRLRELPVLVGVWLNLWDGPNVVPEIVIWRRIGPVGLELGSESSAQDGVLGRIRLAGLRKTQAGIPSGVAGFVGVVQTLGDLANALAKFLAGEPGAVLGHLTAQPGVLAEPDDVIENAVRLNQELTQHLPARLLGAVDCGGPLIIGLVVLSQRVARVGLHSQLVRAGRQLDA